MTTIQDGGLFIKFPDTYGIVALIVYILLLVANWKIFEKCGEAGWKGLIPIYSNYMEFKLFWGNTLYFWIWIICAFLTQVPVIRIIAYIVELVIVVKLAFKMSYSFGHGIGFGLGLCFLPNIFTFILAFGSSTYHGISGKTQFEETFEDKVNDVFNDNNNGYFQENRYDNTPDDNIIDAEFTEKKDDTENKGE